MKLYKVYTVTLREKTMPDDMENAINMRLLELQVDHQCNFELLTMFPTYLGADRADLAAIFVGGGNGKRRGP